MRSELLAAGAAALGVCAAWEVLAALEQGAATAALHRWLRPLRRAGMGEESPLAERRRLALVCAVTLLAAGWLVGGLPVAATLAMAGPWVVRAAVRGRRRRWRAGLRDGAPGAARAIADALAGGHSIRGAIAEAARGGGVGGPAGRELRAAAHALVFGETTDAVLDRLRARAADPAWDALVAAILLQRDAGGDLARLLRDLAGSLEAAARLARDARAVTAQARFTGGLIAALPVGAMALAELASPGYLPGLLRAPAAAAMVVAAIALQVAGLLAIRRLGRLPE